MFSENNKLKRLHLSNPYSKTHLSKRLIENNSIDLRNNSYIFDLGSGYDVIKPIDSSKIIK